MTVNDTILVSSNDTEEGAAAAGQRQRGKYTIHSGLTTGLGIRLNQGSALFSLLSATAPGRGGLITLSTRGSGLRERLSKQTAARSRLIKMILFWERR